MKVIRMNSFKAERVTLSYKDEDGVDHIIPDAVIQPIYHSDAAEMRQIERDRITAASISGEFAIDWKGLVEVIGETGPLKPSLKRYFKSIRIGHKLYK